MTAQIEDIYRYHEEEYKFIAKTGNMPFHPRDYGFNPTAWASNCWAGYYCEYDIRDDGLFLHSLYIYNEDGKYPEFNGVSVHPEENDIYAGGIRCYSNVNLLIPYTGAILAGKEFIWDYYIHMGYQMPYAYKVLKGFLFENGKLTEIIDQSELAEKMREKINTDGESWSLIFDGKHWKLKEKQLQDWDLSLW